MTTPQEWAEFERLKEFLKGHSLADILASASEKAFNEAAALRAIGYQTTAQKLEELAEVLGCAFVPEVGTKR